jgi:hypothetical protein
VGREVTVLTRFVAVADIHGGALHFTLPAHRYAACRATLHATPGPGATFGKVRANGVALRAGTFSIQADPVTLDVEVSIAGRAPIAWLQHDMLGAGWNAGLVTVLAPATSRELPKHAIFVIDASRSMDLVGSRSVATLVRTLADALPRGTDVAAIGYHRTAARLYDGWISSTDCAQRIEAALARLPRLNGSDLAGGLALARQTIAEVHEPAIVIAIGDGLLGDTAAGTLEHALGGKAEVHAIVVDPAHTRAPAIAALDGLVAKQGGTVVEIESEELDRALGAVDDWLRPGYLELALGGAAIPHQVRAGGGFARTIVYREGHEPRVLSGHRDVPFRATVQAAPAAPIAQLTLAEVSAEAFADDPDDEREVARAEVMRDHFRGQHAVVDASHALTVLTTTGKIAGPRAKMIEGGGTFERSVAVIDPPTPLPDTRAAPTPSAMVMPSAIARITLERLFRDQLQPRAYHCYQRALGNSPRLAGTAHFEIYLGRGEVTQVRLTGLGDDAFDACLLDVAYSLEPPAPDFALNSDDQTLARYPLTFSVHEDKPFVVAGDADSSSPLDIDAIQGGVPASAATPLGKLRPRQRP